MAAVSAHHLPQSVPSKWSAKRSPSPTNYTPSNLSVSEEFYSQTKEIIHESFYVLLATEFGIRTNGFTTGVVDPKFSNEVNKRAYQSLTHACRQFFKQNSGCLREMADKIDLSDSTLCSTFHTTMYSMFSDDVNWGRIVALLCFAVFMAAKAHQNGKAIIIQSLEGWLINFICSNLQPFIVKSKGWASVPDKFNPEKTSSDKNGSGSWLTIAAVGLGAALVTAFLT